jgi:hypothetical protein
VLGHAALLFPHRADRASNSPDVSANEGARGVERLVRQHDLKETAGPDTVTDRGDGGTGRVRPVEIR